MTTVKWRVKTSGAELPNTARENEFDTEKEALIFWAGLKSRDDVKAMSIQSGGPSQRRQFDV